MKLMEYQAQQLFEKFGVPVKAGCVIDNTESIAPAMEEKNMRYPVVVKAQIQSGHRGQAGGVQFAHNFEEARRHAGNLLGRVLLGLMVNKLYLVEMADYKIEWYLSIMLDRLTKQPIIIFSAEGGMEIEDTAREKPDAIKKIVIDPMIGVQDYMARYLLSSTNQSLTYTKQLDTLLKNLYRCFMDYDCMLAEINPLVVDNDDNLIALDGKGDQPIADFLRDATFVPDTKDILPLLSEMQTSHDQIVVVVDEYGGTAGIITIEDIVEEIVGEIEDEFDPDNKYLTRLSRREWLVDGRFSCDDAIELGWPLEESDDYETIAGWILELCDSVPDIGEVFEVAGYKFKVQSMRGQRISLIRVIAPAETDKKDSESSAEKPAASGAGSANPHDGDE